MTSQGSHGSQAVLGTYDEETLPGAVVRSVEADLVVPTDLPPNAPYLIAANLGQGSRFHATHGYYADGMTMDELLLPAGWEGRARTLLTESTTRPGLALLVTCPEVHDLAASKLAAFRLKDRTFVGVLVHAGLVDADIVAQRCAQLPADTAAQVALRDQAYAYAVRHLDGTPPDDVDRWLPHPTPGV